MESVAKRFQVQFREAGGEIESFSTPEDAYDCLYKFENEDKKDNTFEEDFYLVYDIELEEAV